MGRERSRSPIRERSDRRRSRSPPGSRVTRRRSRSPIDRDRDRRRSRSPQDRDQRRRKETDQRRRTSRSPERSERRRSPNNREQRRRSRSAERKDDRRRRDSPEKHAKRDDDAKSSPKRSQPKNVPTDISTESMGDMDEEMQKMMGFGSFDSSKNKKVDGNYEGAAQINKPRRYRQYMNRKGEGMVVLIDSDLLGALLSVNCGTDGLYQGLLDSIEGHHAITLNKCFREGHQIPGGLCRILLADVKSVRVLVPADKKEKRQVSYNGNRKTVSVSQPSQPAEEKKSVHTTVASGNSNQSSSQTQTMTRIDVNTLLSMAQSSRPTSSGCVTTTESSPNTTDNKQETPHYEEFGQFKKFSRQVPAPRTLENRKTPRNRYVGPTGIPEVDCSNGYYGMNERGYRLAGLRGPLNKNELNSDFDFEASDQQFQRDRLDDDVVVQLNDKSKERNFGHDENIISDPERLTTWVNSRSSRSTTAGKDIG